MGAAGVCAAVDVRHQRSPEGAAARHRAGVGRGGAALRVEEEEQESLLAHKHQVVRLGKRSAPAHSTARRRRRSSSRLGRREREHRGGSCSLAVPLQQRPREPVRGVDAVQNERRHRPAMQARLTGGALAGREA